MTPAEEIAPLLTELDQHIRDWNEGGITFTMADTLSLLQRVRDAFDAQRRARAEVEQERDAHRLAFERELDGNATLRKLHGARDEESFIAFIERLSDGYKRADAAESRLQAFRVALEALPRHEPVGSWMVSAIDGHFIKREDALAALTSSQEP